MISQFQGNYSFNTTSATMYGSRTDLLKGLKMIIDKVELLRDSDVVFNMHLWSSCVIGKVINMGNNWGNHIQKILNEVFGAELHQNHTFKRSLDNPFCIETDVKMNPTQREVITLFTTKVGQRVTPEQWLDAAYKVYNSNMGIK